MDPKRVYLIRRGQSDTVLLELTEEEAFELQTLLNFISGHRSLDHRNVLAHVIFLSVSRVN